MTTLLDPDLVPAMTAAVMVAVTATRLIRSLRLRPDRGARDPMPLRAMALPARVPVDVARGRA
ncbi:MAG TPA: hypothetical protein VND94_13025 [Terriglobia bacterium]|nr:hypothetical protein [Terriglobia bacterium]